MCANNLRQDESEGTELEEDPSSYHYEGADEDSDMLSNCDSAIFSQKQMDSETNSQMI